MSFLFPTLLIFLLFLHKELLNSLVVEWYSNVEMRNEQNYKDGKPDGLWAEWYEDGRKKAEVTCKDGKPDGLWTDWPSNGQKRVEVTCKDGKLEACVPSGI